jgi:hypothetical protein
VSLQRTGVDSHARDRPITLNERSAAARVERVMHGNGWRKRPEEPMAKCETCGNDYDKAFKVIQGESSHTFDSFECAIHALAPRCGHCGCTIVGHGVEGKSGMFCCANCARHDGETQLRDRAS